MVEVESRKIIKKYQTDINDIIKIVKGHYKKSDIKKIQKAYEYAIIFHGEKKRETGEPYIIHPIYVAKILANMSLDDETIIAGLLHDVIEDTKATYDDIKREFGKSVADMVIRCYKT